MNSHEMENVISSHLHQYKNITRFPIYSYDFIDTPNIDADFQKIGREVVKSIDLKSLKGFDENSVTFITTIVSIYGGGTRMIEDWTGFYQSMGMKCSIIITSKEGSDKSAIEKFVNKGVDCLFVESTGSAVSNIKSFQEILADLRPKTAFLCSFAMDYVAIAGIQDALVDKLYLNLVLDHGLSTGLHLPQITKIITYRPYLAHLMKDYIKIDGDKIIYIPLSKKDTNSLDINARKYLENGYILSASSTSYQYKISDSYIYRYIDVIVDILQITKGKHIHVGEISDDQVEFIRNSLDKLNIDPNSFEVIKYTKSIAKFLYDNNVDVYLQTFPSGGGITCVEAMQAGVKIISHIHSHSYLYNARDMLYPECFFWKNPDELYDHLRCLTKDDVVNEGMISRKFFDNELSIEKFFTRDSISGLPIDYELVKKNFAYSLNNIQYLSEVSCFFDEYREGLLKEGVIKKRSKSDSRLKNFEKKVLRVFFRFLFPKKFRSKVKDFLLLK